MVDESPTTLRQPPAARTGAPAQDRVRPGTVAEAADALRVAASAGRSVLFTGAGTALDWGAPVTCAGLVVETAGLDRVVRHAVEDWTVTAEAGMPLTRLQETLAPSGQWLPLDPPAASAGASLGGLLATADAGPRRLAYGGIADLVIGARLVLADGTVVRTGGQVIKNVAGYDLAKLAAGSLGAFALVAELTFRVHPLPAAGATLELATDDAARALAAGRAVARSPLEPVAAEWDGGRLLVRFHGTEAGVAHRLRAAADVPELAGARELRGRAEDTAWQELADGVHGEEGDTVLRAGALPAQLPALARALQTVSRQTGVHAALFAGVATGVLTVRLRGGDAAAHAQCLALWREAVRTVGGTVTLRRRRDGVDTLTDPWGSAPSTAPLLRALKQQFDPAGRCAPGRFAPWL